jgi:hypothetical protein
MKNHSTFSAVTQMQTINRMENAKSKIQMNDSELSPISKQAKQLTTSNNITP